MHPQAQPMMPNVFPPPKEHHLIHYPFYPPTDNELRYEENLSMLKVCINPSMQKNNPVSLEKQAKFCPVCDFPIVVRVVLIPCKHYMCYECYVLKGSTFCKMYLRQNKPLIRCHEAILQFHRLPDMQKFYSCDLETCSKHFETDQEYIAHMKLH